jgi:hypothetical protein
MRLTCLAQPCLALPTTLFLILTSLGRTFCPSRIPRGGPLISGRSTKLPAPTNILTVLQARRKSDKEETTEQEEEGDGGLLTILKAEVVLATAPLALLGLYIYVGLNL